MRSARPFGFDRVDQLVGDLLDAWGQILDPAWAKRLGTWSLRRRVWSG